MSLLNQIYLYIGLTVLLVGLFSKIIKSRYYFSVPLLATLFGILIGPRVFSFIDPTLWKDYHKIVEETARITLGIALMSVALRIPPAHIKKYRSSIIWILLTGMAAMFLASGLLTYAIASVPLLIAFIIAGSITPTDPVVASAIVTGKLAEEKIPERIRKFISTEAGANDGLAYPFVLLPILLYQYSAETALSDWLIKIILWRVGAAALIGLIIGYAAAKLLLWAEYKGFIEKVYFLGYTISLSLISLSAAKLLGTDGVFSVFIAGMTFSYYVNATDRSDEEKIQESVNHFFTLPVFVLFGAVLPWSGWREIGWNGILLIAAVLLFRRLPWIYLFRKIYKPLKTTRDSLFTGWFGPIGVAALYYITFSLGEIGDEIIWTLGTLIIFSSIIVHGITATPFTKKFKENRNG